MHHDKGESRFISKVNILVNTFLLTDFSECNTVNSQIAMK